MLSVIITTYNRPQMLREAINSVLRQDYLDKEIIVVDDNSSMDNSFCIPSVDKYIKNSENQGLGKNHIIGFNASKGEYICFLDDDDYYTDYSYYSNAISMLDKYSELSFVSGSSITKYEPSGKEEPYILTHGHKLDAIEYLQNILITYRKPQSTFTTVFRKSVLLEMGLKKMLNPEDAALYLRALSVGGYVCLLENMVGVYRVHSNNMSKALDCQQMINLQKEILEVYKLSKRKLTSPSFWWYKQFRFTFDFFIGSNPQKENINRMIKWGYSHSAGSIYIWLFLFHYQLIQIKKRVLDRTI